MFHKISKRQVAPIMEGCWFQGSCLPVAQGSLWASRIRRRLGKTLRKTPSGKSQNTSRETPRETSRERHQEGHHERHCERHENHREKMCTGWPPRWVQTTTQGVQIQAPRPEVPRRSGLGDHWAGPLGVCKPPRRACRSKLPGPQSRGGPVWVPLGLAP